MAAASQLGAMPAAGAYLDLAEPDLSTVAVGLAAAGHQRAVVTPLLFTEAFHASVDVPDAVRDASTAAGMELVVTDILGTGDDMLVVVEVSMRLAGVTGHQPVVLVSVGSSSPAANDAVADLAARLASRRTAPVLPAFGTRSPRVVEVLPQLGDHAAIVPLFLSPGLLLDPLARLAAERGLTMAAPLGTLAAPLLVERYHRALVR
jgi:sirohydrochlorin ferrochelatase